jgi:ribonuclease VapC
MLVDACAMVAIIMNEQQGPAFANAIEASPQAFTTSIACFEAVFVLARPDCLNRPPLDVCESLLEWLADRGIALGPDVLPTTELVRAAVEIAVRLGLGKRYLSLADCFHYAHAKVAGTGMITNDVLLRQSGLPVLP